MINPLPYLSIANPLQPLLNTTLPPSLISTLVNSSLSATIGCWQQNPPEQQQLVPTTFAECLPALRKIPITDKADVPVIFSRDAQAGFEVPHTWVIPQGRCSIVIDVEEADVQETATFDDIADAARQLMKKCVINPPHLGGKAFVGELERLEILLFGFDPGAYTEQ